MGALIPNFVQRTRITDWTIAIDAILPDFKERGRGLASELSRPRLVWQE